MRDARHAAMVEAVSRMLLANGWATEPEYTFSHFGERGSVDVLARHDAGRAAPSAASAVARRANARNDVPIVDLM